MINLDNGLFFEKLGMWTREPRFARNFEDAAEIQRAAVENKVENAAAAMIGGNPLRVTGFLWAVSN